VGRDTHPIDQATAREIVAAAAIVPFSDNVAILAEADHRIANHLALLISYVRLKSKDIDGLAEDPTRESVRLLLDGVSAQISAVSRLHRSLVSERGSSRIELGRELHEICAPFAAGLSGAVEIVEDYGPGCVVQPEQLLPLSQIVAEVITNAIKHARTDGALGRLRVACREDAGGAVLVEVADSGGGLPATFDPATDGGLGFRLVRGLSQQVGAQVAFESTREGLCFRLRLPPGPGGFVSHPQEPRT
jgi:two-component sensor histidine kinase